MQLIRDSSATGSWNIQEEIRKVRSRATEEMLRARPSSIIDWATLAPDINKSSTSLMAYKAETGMKNKMYSSTNLMDVPLWTVEVTT